MNGNAGTTRRGEPAALSFAGRPRLRDIPAMPRPRRRPGAQRTPMSRERRQFLKLAAIAGATSAIAGIPAALAETAARPDTTKAAPPPPAAPATPEVPPDVVADAKALLSIIERRYGKYLNSEQIAAVERDLQNRVRAGKALREAKLANSDEPDTVFRA